jgi:hypothetical protein
MGLHPFKVAARVRIPLGCKVKRAVVVPFPSVLTQALVFTDDQVVVDQLVVHIEIAAIADEPTLDNGADS